MDADAAAANAENGGEPAMPQYFGSYEVLKTIGKGKFAVVYRAKKIGDDQVVALKRIAVDMMNDKAREKCLKEVRLLQSLDHPNIVRYMDSFICENDLMIVYEWAAAGDLKRQLRKAQERGTGFEERVIWKYFSQICNAMQHMHERRIMHRDLKPANIFLTLDGTIKVGDLGLSRELSEHTIQAHSKVGTPLYMSPEVLKGEGYDFKSDIWSLGCLLYELAMLKSPFKSEGLNLYSLFQKISHGDFTPLPENFSEELRNLAYSMISTKSEDRPEIGDVCKIAQEMRTLTADKAARKKSARADNANSAKSRGATPVEASTKLEPSVRPVMGVADSKPEARRQDQGQGQKQELGIARADAPRGNSRDSRDSRESSRAGERGSGRGRGSREDVKSGVQWDFAKEDEKTDMPPRSAGSRGSRGGQEQGGRPNLQRDSSFKLEPVNDETAPRDPFMGDTGRLFFAGSDAPDSEDETDDNDDDATVKLGLADQGQDTPPGVVALGSDRDPLPGNHGNSGNRYQAGAPAGREGGIGGSGGGGRYSGGNENGRSGSGGKSRSPTHSGINGAAPVASAERAVGGGAAVTSTSASGTVSYRRHKAPASKPPMQAQAQSHGRQRSPGESKGDVDLGDTGGMGGTGMLPNSESAYRVNGKKLGEHLQHSAPAFALMEVLYDKLNALGYPLEDPYVKEQSRQQASRGRLLPIHFACDLHLFPTVAGHSKGYQFMQFRRMANVAAWLCGRIRGTPADLAAQLNLEQDAPMTTAKQLLRAAQAVQGPLSAELGQISPTSLTPGFGLNVCTLLMHLADAALGVVQVPTTLLYRDQAPDEEADVGLDVEDEGILEESAQSGSRASAFLATSQTSNDEEGESQRGISAGGRLGVSTNILAGDIDPLLWKMETDRVAVKLDAQRRGGGVSLRGGSLGSEWNDHVDALKQYAALNRGDKSGGAGTGGGGGSSGGALVESMVADLQGLKAGIVGALGKIRLAEQVLNRREQLGAFASQYSTFRSDFTVQEQKAEAATATVGKLTSQLAELQERYDDMAEALTAKTEGDEGTGAGNQIVKLKDGIKMLKTEIKNMGMGIALLNHTLLSHRQQLSKSQFRQLASQRKARRGEASVLSDEDLID